jgi:hypothetical protein
MKGFSPFRALLFALFAVLTWPALPVPGLAASEPPASATPLPAKPRPYPFRSVVVSADPAAQTFQMGKKKIRTVHINPATRLLKSDGTPATFGDLTAGAEIRGSVRKRPDGELDAVSVKIGPKIKPGEAAGA